MDLTKEAMKYLADTSKEEMVSDSNGNEYILEGYEKVRINKANSIKTHTLDSIVDYIKSNVDEYSELIVHVLDPETVHVSSQMLDDKDRDTLMTANAFVNEINLRWQNAEDFNLMLQANFVDNEDKAKVLAYIGNLQDEAVKNYSDDGVSQTVTVKRGVATVGEAILPNPVVLAPYRTFPEIEQPESTFVFRMKEGAIVTLVESDGNLWKLEAIKRIKEYLKKEIGDMPADREVYIFG